MVRPAEKANTTNPQAERRFDSKVIMAFVIGAIVLIFVFLFVGNNLSSFEKTRSPQSNSSQTQESDKRAVP